MTSSIIKFQPSSGSIGCAFIADWCGTCEKGKHEPCEIAIRTMWYRVEEPEYPSEWRYVDGNPVCTAHIELGQPIPEPRCERTADMFECVSGSADMYECVCGCRLTNLDGHCIDCGREYA